MSDYRTFVKEKWIFFFLAVVAYFAPFIAVTACFLPLVKAAQGFKIAVGLGIVLINAIPFLMGIFRALFAHFPMLNMFAIVFLALASFFMLDVFQRQAEIFLWIELAAACGSILSCIFWALHRKYSGYRNSLKATLKSGAFLKRTEDN